MQRESRIAEAIIRNGTDERRLGVLSDLISDELNIVVSGYTKDKVIALASLTEAVGRYLADNLCDPDRPVDDVDMVLAAVEQSVYDRLTDMDGYRENSTVFTELCRKVNEHQADTTHQNDVCNYDRCDRVQCKAGQCNRIQYSFQNDHQHQNSLQHQNGNQHQNGHLCNHDDPGSGIPDFRTGLEILTEELSHRVPDYMRIIGTGNGRPKALLVYDLDVPNDRCDDIDGPVDSHPLYDGPIDDDLFDDEDDGCCIDWEDISEEHVTDLLWELFGVLFGDPSADGDGCNDLYGDPYEDQYEDRYDGPCCDPDPDQYPNNRHYNHPGNIHR